MKMDGLSLVGAINKVKAYAGITEDTIIPQRMSATRVAKKYAERKRRQAQPNKILSENSLSRFVFDKKKLQPWVDEGIDLDIMRRYGVRYDPVDNRIIYPVRNYDGKLISISGRTCDPQYKEKGIRKYTYYGQLGGLLETLCMYSFNEENIKAKKEIILFEGVKSCLKAYGWGFDNTAACLTSHLSQSQLMFLISLSCNHEVKVVFALDSDVDVRQDQNIRRLCRYADVSWVKNRDNILLPKEAPVDQGRQIFQNLYERRERL